MASILTIAPPLAGIVRSRGFQKQPPFSCREAINFWPQHAVTGAETVAIRPPLDEYIAVASNPVNLLCAVNGTTSDTPQRTFVAAVNGQLKYWDGSALQNVGGAGSVATTRAVYAAAFEQKVYIPGSTNLVYDYPSDTLSTWTASSGSIPTDMRILVAWAGGLWGAAQPSQPHVVSGCATGAPLNWNFSASGEGAAFQTTGDNAGLIGGPVSALMPTMGDSMIVSTPDSMHIWRAHPRRGGTSDILHSTVGVRGQGAWCMGPDGTIFAITNKGLSAITGSAVEHISQKRIPNELIGLDYDYTSPNIAMAYDNRFNGIHITVRDGADSEAWFYDLTNGGLFQQEFNQYPHVMLAFNPLETGRASGVLFGGSGGLYRHDLDGTEAYTQAKLVIGPMKLSSNATERSMIQEAQVILGGGTDAVDTAVGMYCGPTADSSYAAATSGNTASKHETTVDAIMAKHGRIRPRCAGHAMTYVFDLQDAGSDPKLEFEETTLVLEPAGKERGYVQHSDVTGPRAGSYVPPGPGTPSSITPVNLLTGLFASYGFSEPSGGTRSDDHTGNYDLSVSAGAVATVVGKIGNGANLPAAESGGQPQNLVNTSSLSVEDFPISDGAAIAFWVSVETVRAANGAVTVGVGEGSLSLAVGTNGDLTMTLVTDLDAEEFEQLILTPSDFSVDLHDGSFHFVACSFDPDTLTMKVWVDALDNSEEVVLGEMPTWGAGPLPETLRVNGNTSTPAVNDDMKIDLLYVRNRALSAADFASLLNGGAGREYSDF